MVVKVIQDKHNGRLYLLVFKLSLFCDLAAQTCSIRKLMLKWVSSTVVKWLYTEVLQNRVFCFVLFFREE